MPTTQRAMGGFALRLESGALTLERDLRRCAHCGCFWVAGMEYRGSDGELVERGFCRKHMAPTCGSPGCVTMCVDVARDGTFDLRSIDSSLPNIGQYRGGELPPGATLKTCGHCRRPYVSIPGLRRVRREWCVIHNGECCGACEVPCSGH